MPMTITLPSEKVLSGRENGQKARKLLHLDELDYNKEPQICVLISISTWALNASFFIGCFLESMDHLGCKQRFEEKYKFFSDDEAHFSRMIEDGTSRCDSILKTRRGDTHVTADQLSRYFHLQ